MTMGILLPAISAEFDLSYLQPGLFYAVPVWGVVIVTLPLSLWTVRYRPVMLTTTTLAIAGIFLFLQASATMFIVLLAARLGFGVVLAAREPARALFMQQWFRQREVIFVNGVTISVLSFGFAGGLLGMPLLLSTLDNNWRSTLYVLCGFSVLLSIVWAIVARDKPVQDHQVSGTDKQRGLPRSIFLNKQLWITGLAIFGGTSAEASFLAFYPTVMLDRYDFPLRFSGVVMGLMYLGCSISCLVVGRMAINWEIRSKILWFAGICMPFMFAALLFTDSLPFLCAIAVMNGLTVGYMVILLTIGFHLPGIHIRHRPTAHVFLFTFLALGTATGPVLSGFLQDSLNNLTLVLILASSSSVFVAAPGFFVRKLSNPSDASQVATEKI